MSAADHSLDTREKYHRQHVRVANDDDAMERFIGMFSHKYFGLDEQFFSRTRVIDAGCGSTGKLLIALYRLGARDIHGFDLGTDFIESAKGALSRYSVPQHCVSLKSGSVLDIPHGDSEFDFTACHGVLIHLNNMSEVERGMKELGRITKRGGYLYTVFGCVGGALEGNGIDSGVIGGLRKYYRENAAFKNFIDNIQPEDFHSLIDLIEVGLKKNEGQNISLAQFKPLFDVDFAVLWQNLMQPEVRLPVDEQMVRRMYAENGFKEPRRLARYVHRKNIRKFTAQLHIQHSHPVVQMIYGSGNLEFIAEKA